VPTGKLSKYIAALASCEATAALDRIAQIAAGNGLMDASEQRRYLQQLKRAAARGRRPATVRATAASLAQIGIAVETLAPSGAAPKQADGAAPKQADGEIGGDGE
jgi:hypothetical protein